MRMDNILAQPIDVVIPCHSKDEGILEYCIACCRKYTLGLCTIYLISNSVGITMPGVVVIHQDNYFSQGPTVKNIRKRREKECSKQAGHAGSSLADLYKKIFKVHKLYKRLGFFYNPNTLESWCCRYVQNHPKQFGHLLAYQKICASAIQVNMVNTSTVNEWDNTAELTVEKLAEKYHHGWRLDIDWMIKHKPTQTHSDREYFNLTDQKGFYGRT